MNEQMKAMLASAGLVVTEAMEANLVQAAWTNEPVTIVMKEA